MALTFSIVIALAPYRNAEILESLESLDYDKNKYEIIVEQGYNPSENRNKGALKSKGEIIVFFDDDALIELDILKIANEFFNNYPNMDIVGGPQLTPKTDKTFARASGYALASKFGAWDVSKRYRQDKLNLNADETFLTSACLFCKREVFNQVNFNPKLYPGEDPDFISRAKELGFKIAYNPNLIIRHKRRASFKGLVNQIFNYGFFRPKKESFIETLKRPFFLIPTGFLFYVFILILLGLTNLIFSLPTIINILLLFPFTVYLLINLLLSSYLTIKNKDALTFYLLPLIFITIHLSYGLGLLCGISKKFK